MLDFTPTMLTPTFAPTSITYPPEDQEKVNPGHLYLRQQRTFEIIQLVEGPPPPRRQISSAISSSEASSSTCSTEYEDSDSLSSDEDYDSVCSSYCSSDEFSEDVHLGEDPEMPTLDDTYSSRMKRVFAWRESFFQAMNITAPDHPPLKRKGDDHPEPNDQFVPKRLRSDDGERDCTVTSHSCPACDTSFPTRESLLLHGRAVGASEACCVAVEYNLE